MLNQVLKLYNLPFGFLGLIKFLVPSLLMVATESRKDSSFFIWVVSVSVIVIFLCPTSQALQLQLSQALQLQLSQFLPLHQHTALPADPLE